VSRQHLFVDVSSHGFGHLAQVAPVLNALAARLPTLRLTVRSGLPTERLRARLLADFTHIAAASDFGYRMHDALCVDLPATAAAYRTLHADWPARVAAEAAFLSARDADLVLSDVAYLPLAAAAQAGIPSVAMSSLNWADLLAHFFPGEAWLAPIHRQMLAAYNSAECFLRLTPGMPMADLLRRQVVGPVAAQGRDCRAAVRAQLACPPNERLVLIAFGGFSKRLPMETWPSIPGVRWLVHETWQLAQANATAFETLGYAFPDLLRAVDAVLTKPGYGTFAEAACNGAPVLYVRRHDWPEQDCLIDWLSVHGRCHVISDTALVAGDLATALDALWQQPAPLAPAPVGATEAAAVLLRWLTTESRNV